MGKMNLFDEVSDLVEKMRAIATEKKLSLEYAEFREEEFTIRFKRK